MIMTCTCTHKDQDDFHGKNRRVHNMTKTTARCTVCGNEKGLSSTQIKDNNTKGKK